MKIQNSLLGFGAMLLLAFPSLSASQTIVPNISVTRSSGAAPLYVFFDATGTTCTGSPQCTSDGGAFRNLLYQWDFGDTGPSGTGSWSVRTHDGAILPVGTGMPRNRAFGAVAGHYFQNGGTYTVTLTVRGPTGGPVSTTTQIIVAPANSQWPGTATRCYSTGTDFTGCPAGAVTVPNFTNFASARADCDQGNRRCLFKAGDTFMMAGEWFMTSPATAGPKYLGSFGTANNGRARIQFTDAGFKLRPTNGGDYRIVDFTFIGAGTTNSGVIDAFSTFTDILIKNTSIVPGTINNVVAISGVQIDSQGAPCPTGLGVFENDWRDVGIGNGNGGNIVFICSLKTAIVGNRLYDSVSGEHNVRIQHGEGFAVSSNTMGEPRFGKGIIQIRSRIQDQPPVCSGQCGRPTKFGIVSDNVLFGDQLGNHVVATGSETDTSTSQGEDIIIERNFMTATEAASHGLQSSSVFSNTRRGVYRNNIFHARNWTQADFLVIGSSGGGGQTDDLAAYGNTFYVPPPIPSTFAAIQFAPWEIIFNNLLYAITGSGIDAFLIRNNPLEGPNRGDNPALGNDIASANPFAVNDPNQFMQFGLAAGAPQIDAGVTTLYNPIDAYANFRSGAPDIGAVEFGSSMPPATGPQVQSTTPSSQSSVSSSFTVSMPAERPNSDLYVFSICKAGVNEIFEPAGLTQLANGTDGGFINRVGVFYRIGSSEPASYTFTASGPASWTGTVVRIGNFDPNAGGTGNPIAATNVTMGTDNTAEIPTLTVDEANTLRFVLSCSNGTPTTPYAPSGFTPLSQISSVVDRVLRNVSRLEPAPGTTGGEQIPLGTGVTSWRTIELLLKP
jgi:hypothetical protein